MTVEVREGSAGGALGTGLFWRIWQPQESRAALCVLHGLGEHSGRYRPLAEDLGRRGISVFTFDLRGHGHSQGSRGDVDFFSRFLEDLLAMESVMEMEVGGGIPRFLLGHSMGGLIALRRLQTLAEPYAGGILSAPWLATALPEWLCRLGGGLGWVLPGLRVPSGLGGGLLHPQDLVEVFRRRGHSTSLDNNPRPPRVPYGIRATPPVPGSDQSSSLKTLTRAGRTNWSLNLYPFWKT